LHVSLDPRIGTEIAGYRIERVLGRGGMSVVYLAEHLRLKRKVALKLLMPDLAEDERFRERFLRESHLAATLDHSHVIPIYDADEAQGLLYIAMRYVEGNDLKTLLVREGPLEPRRALALASQVAGALDAAHERGLVHRDVKPGNILLTEESGAEHVYLADFGLTKETSSESGLTETGHFVGTADYVAPEQIDRRPLEARADVYSLGCVLFECLTGEAPFRSERLMAVLWGHLNEPPPSVSERNRDLPPGLDAVLVRALAKDPEDRYATCRELVAAARAELGMSAELPAPAAAPIRQWKWPLIATAAILVAIALVVGLVIALGDEEEATPRPILPLTADSLVRIDPATNELVAAIEVGSNPVAISIGEGMVWVASRDERKLYGIDPDDNSVARTIDVTREGPPVWLGAQRGALYVAHWPVGGSALKGSVRRYDPRSGSSSLVRTGVNFFYVAGRDGMWFLDGLADEVSRADPETGRVVGPPVPLTHDADWGVVGEGALWVFDLANPFAVSRVDPATNEVVATLALDGVGGFIGGAAGEGAVWIADPGGDALLRLDAATNRITETIRAGRRPTDVAVGEGSVWVTSDRDRSISRFDPRTSDIVATIELGGRPRVIAVGEGAVWAAVETG
jgi:streptogramin lyase/tRNA A-37 threonylcarbamoyl transferase component Bud32